MLRSLCALAVLALPLAASGQIVHDVIDGVWFMGGTHGADVLIAECDGGNVKANGTDPVSGPTPCADVTGADVTLGGGDDFAYLRTLDAFDFDPEVPLLFDGGVGDDVLQVDVSGLAGGDALSSLIAQPPSGPPLFEASGPAGKLVEVAVLDPTTLFAVEFGPGDDTFTVRFTGTTVDLSEIEAYGRGGDDTVDGTDSTVPLPFLFDGGPGDDELIAGGLRTRLVWRPGDGTDRVLGGDDVDELIVDGALDELFLHLISGILDDDCAFFDFDVGGGVIDSGIDRARIAPGPGGVDFFSEFDCALPEVDWEGDSGFDSAFLRGGAGGENGVFIDFALDAVSTGSLDIFTDGFESGNVSSWSNTSPDRQASRVASGGGTLWDGLDYQDWPSFADPSTSGPSTVLVRGRPDFAVTLDLGPDGASGRGGAVDTLLVDPVGLPFTDDGSQIVIDGGPPITYAGAEVVRIGPATDAAAGPDGEAPTLAVFPNPTAGAASVRLGDARAEAARVAVVDVLGREVAVLHEGPVAAGSRTWAVPADRLAPGLYLVRAEGAGWTATQRLSVVR